MLLPGFLRLRRLLRRTRYVFENNSDKLSPSPIRHVTVLTLLFFITYALYLQTGSDVTSNFEQLQPSSRDSVQSPLIPAALPPSQRSSLHPRQPLHRRVDQLVGDGHAAKHALVDRYLLPLSVVDAMPQPLATKLYWKLMYVDVVRALTNLDLDQPSTTPSVQSCATVLFIHVQNGLGNRLRALASGLALARSTNRVPVLIWQRDAHLNASANQLLQTTAPGSDFNTVIYKDLIVMEQFLSWQTLPFRHSHFKIFNYMQKDGPGADSTTIMHFAPLTDSPAIDKVPDTIPSSVPLQAVLQHQSLANLGPQSFDSTLVQHYQHVYFKSAYIVRARPSELLPSGAVDRELRNLVPAPAVTAIVSTIDPFRLNHSYGIHIRSRSLADDNVAVDNDCEYTRVGAYTTNYWRSYSKLPAFVSKMDQLSRASHNCTFFVATDDVDVTTHLKKLYPNRVDTIDRSCDSRDDQCVIYAFADLICLSKTKRLYGSNWSSFSEVAGKLSQRKPFLSGRDFGRPPRAKFFRRFLNSLSIFGQQLLFRINRPYLRCPE